MERRWRLNEFLRLFISRRQSLRSLEPKCQEHTAHLLTLPSLSFLVPSSRPSASASHFALILIWAPFDLSHFEMRGVPHCGRMTIDARSLARLRNQLTNRICPFLLT